MSIKEPYESWHRADISLHSRPVKAHSWARSLPDSPHFIPVALPVSLTRVLSLLPNYLCQVCHQISFSISIFFPFSIPWCSSSAHNAKLLLPLQDLEEELELDRRRVSEAEGGAKRAEEELAVAKERLLLQEDELQSRAGSRSVCLLTCLERSHNSENQLSSCISIIHSGSALIRFSPHAVIMYTENATDAHYSSSTKANSFIKVSSYPVSKNRTP